MPPGWWPHANRDWEHLWKAIARWEPDHASQLLVCSNWQKIEQGETNFNYCLRLSQQKYFVQILSQTHREKRPVPRVDDIHAALHGLTALDEWLVPCRFESDRLRIFDWVKSNDKVKKDGDWLLLRKDFFIFLGALHSHRKKLPILNMQCHIDHYYQLAREKKSQANSYLFSLREKALLLAKSFQADTVCHNDLSPDNILVASELGTSTLKIIDWEYACISDPAFELAVICENFDLNEKQQNRLILIYSQNSVFQIKREKLNKMKLLYRILSELWRL